MDPVAIVLLAIFAVIVLGMLIYNRMSAFGGFQKNCVILLTAFVRPLEDLLGRQTPKLSIETD